MPAGQHGAPDGEQDSTARRRGEQVDQQGVGGEMAAGHIADRGGLVDHQHGDVGEQRAGQRDSLPRPPGAPRQVPR